MSARILLITFLTLLMSCQGPSVSQLPATLNGDVRIRGNQTVIIEGAKLHITLQDLSLMDTAAKVVEEISVPITGSPPYRFSLVYDTANIFAGRTYGIRATITANKQLMYTSTEYINPFLENPLSINLSSVARQSMSEKPDASLANTYWRAVDIYDVPVEQAGQRKEIHLKMMAGRATGTGGCNQFTGTFETDKSLIKLGPLGTTMMMCADGMEIEDQFFRALNTATRYLVHGDILTLYANDIAVARFEAVYLL